MIVSIHIADLGLRATPGVLLRPPKPTAVDGLTYVETTITAPLGEPPLPPQHPGRVGMIAAWEDDRALDRFLATDRLGRRLTQGWEVRLQPLRVFGTWAGWSGLPTKPLPVDDDEPVGVLTLGRLRLRRAGPFHRSAVPAEQEAVENPAVLASIGLARPPRLVATFSLWRTAAEMREYATVPGGTHEAAVKAHGARPFHHESAFLRFRPYASRGSWDGRDPLAGTPAATAA
jgi:hypothetical protein